MVITIKTLLVMKLTAVLLIATCLEVIPEQEIANNPDLTPADQNPGY